MGIRTSTDAGLALIQDIDKSQGYQQRDKKAMNSHTDDGDAKNGPERLFRRENNITVFELTKLELDVRPFP